MSQRPELASALRRRGQRRLGLFHQVLKPSRILHGDVGEDLAIQFDARFFQPVDELVVAQSIQLGGGADAHDPQRAVLALALLTARVGELQSALDRFFCRAVKF